MTNSQSKNAQKLFSAGAALVALRVVDDSFLQPAAGTSATDHLVSGLVPLAFIAATVVAFRKSGSVVQGLLALLLGLAGVVAGADAFYYAAEAGLSSGDLSGFLAGFAGLGLLGVGMSVLWRGRRRDGSRPRRIGTRLAIAVGAALFVSTLVVPVAVGYLMTHIQTPEQAEAHLGTAYRDVEIETSDGLTLRGWYLPSRNGAAVIVFPGRRESTQSRARMLSDHGYGVLLLDRRGEGESDGVPNAFGWGGYRDVAAGVEFLGRQADVDPERIAGLGLSVGGEMLIELAARADDGLAAVISDGAGTRSWAEEKETPDGNLLGAPSLIAKTAAVAVFSDTAPPPSMFDLIPEVAPTPLLLISSREAANEVLAPDFAEIAGAEAETWSIPGNHHIGGMDVAPEAYERRVIDFLERSLNDGR